MSDTKRKRYGAGPRMRSENGENYHHRVPSGSARGSRNNNSQTSGHHYHRMNSSDGVRKIVQEEGRTARNLVIYNVPVEEKRQHRGNGHHEGRSRYSRKPPLKDQNVQGIPVPIKSKSTSDDSYVMQKSIQDMTKSPKSDNGSRKPDLRARYWKFLFDNLQRAVDAIYETCEQDESEVECKEVIMMLEQSTRDFKSLIERLHLLKAFEESAKDGDRPTSIAWEVRKMSPGKTTSQHGQRSGSSPSPAQRVLNFTETRLEQIPGNSWADKVRGKTQSLSKTVQRETEEPGLRDSLPSPPPPPTTQNGLSASEVETDGSTTIEDDNEGWETVHRGGKSKTKTSPSQRSLENLSGLGKSAGNRNLKRTFSDPHSGIVRKTRYSSDNKGRLAQKSMSVGNHVSPRQRTDSKDSEKENRPTDTCSTSGQSKSTDKSVSRSCAEAKGTETGGKMLYSSSVIKGNSNHSKKEQLKGNTKSDSVSDKRPESTSGTQAAVSELSNDDPCVMDGKVLNVDEEQITVQVTEDIEEEEENIALTKKDNEEEEVDKLTAQLDSELATVMDEEDDLTQQLEQEQEKALENAIMEEETWLKALAQEQNTVIDVETETETESELGNTMSSLDNSQPTLDWDSLCAQYDAAEKDGSLKSWGEMVEEADTEARTPGHGVHMHEKLSSPSRKRSPTESKKRHEEKQAKARELREKLMSEKAERLKDLSKKVEEVRSWKEELMRQRKGTIQIKMQRAEEKRQFQLKMKAQKAHEEEAKANEIAFINTLEAQNKRHDIMSKHQESEARLHDMQEERQRKHEEKLAKEAAVEERRKALQAERQARLKEMEEKRKKRDARVELLQQEKEKERLEAVRNKEREREERLAALNAQQQAHIQELQKKIQQKQDESTQRHQEVLQQIREKAFEMSVLRHSTEDHNEAPKITPYDNKKLCTICNVLIPSEVHLLSHLRGKKHQQALQDNNSGITMTKQEIETFNLKHIVDAPVNSTHPKIVSEKERLKSLKKRCKKLRQRMTTRGLEYENTLSGKQQLSESEHKAKLQKVIRDINKYLQTQDSGPWPQNKVSALDRATGEIGRIMDKKVLADQNSLRVLGGITSLSRILQVIDVTLCSTDLPPVIPSKSLILTCTVFRQACKGCYDNCHYMMFSNKIGTVIDLLIYRLSILLPEEGKRPTSGSSSASGTSSSTTEKLPYDPLAVSLMQLLASILNCLAKYRPAAKSSEASVERMSSTGDAYTVRGNDVISYIISVGIVDKLTQYFRSVQGPIDEDKDAADFLQHSLGLLVSMTKFMSKRNSSTFEKKKAEDPTQLINTYEMTELVGIVSLLYGMLLHSGSPSRSDTPPPEFPQHTMAVALTGLKMLNNMATLNLDMLQKTLGDEGMSLEFRHIASYLMWYCSHHCSDEILHEVIQSVGYFTVLSPDNQVVIQSGQPPTILQQLCSLPFQYFSDPKLTNVLFPTLISCCYNNQSNREILEQELSCMLLANFIEEKQLEAQQAKLHPSKKEKEKSKETDQRMLFTSRFPPEHCLAAQEYFKVT